MEVALISLNNIICHIYILTLVPSSINKALFLENFKCETLLFLLLLAPREHDKYTKKINPNYSNPGNRRGKRGI